MPFSSGHSPVRSRSLARRVPYPAAKISTFMIEVALCTNPEFWIKWVRGVVCVPERVYTD